MDRIGVQNILPVKVSVTIGTILNLNSYFDGHGDGDVYFWLISTSHFLHNSVISFKFSSWKGNMWVTLICSLYPVCSYDGQNKRGVCSFCQNCAKLCGTPGFWQNVLDSFSCIYIEIAYSNLTFCGAYTLSFLVHHTISAKQAHPRFVVTVALYQQNLSKYKGICVFSCVSVCPLVCPYNNMTNMNPKHSE